MNILQIVFSGAVIIFVAPYILYRMYKVGFKLAVNGYDIVAYFKNNEPIKGKKEFSLIYKNKIYYFSSDNNKQIFIKDPNQYLPQYGGFCSYGMSNGYKASIKPEAFSIVDDKLYLNHNLKYREDWRMDKDERIKRADYNWGKLQQKK